MYCEEKINFYIKNCDFAISEINDNISDPVSFNPINIGPSINSSMSWFLIVAVGLLLRMMLNALDGMMNKPKHRDIISNIIFNLLFIVKYNLFNLYWERL